MVLSYPVLDGLTARPFKALTPTSVPPAPVQRLKSHFPPACLHPEAVKEGTDPLTPTRVYTNPLISNLTMLCKYHNGVNDDDPNGPRKKRKRPSRGRMRRHRGRVRLHTPGGKLVGNTHALSSMGAMNLI